ncbi:hypothetical protein ABZW11_30925, partial [Nonomuraea sp. NPDC004580]|uniref:hypothetical protein n=1 Tax=Nonomuraea sp. NPDC004580 TaxID=3154552 RepID=UPI0033BAAEC2
MADAGTAPQGLFPWDELAGACREDPRIRFYVDRESPRATAVRQLVSWEHVLAESSRDRAFRDAIALDSYAEFARLAHAGTRVRTDFERLAAGFSPAALRHFLATRTVLLLLAALSLLVSSWAGLLLLSCQIVAVALIPVAGLTWRAGRAARSLPRLLLAALAAVTALTVPAAATVAGLPFSYGSLLLMGVSACLFWILAVSHEGRPLSRRAKMFLLLPSLAGLESQAARARRRWLEDASENAVMPELIQTINRLLQPSLGTRLLVQDTARLRAIYHPGLLVPTRATRRAQEALRRSDGASIAVAGPRGSGKTTLLHGLCGGDATFSVVVPSPVHYVPKEFLTELFQRVCTAYITDQGFSAERVSVLKRRGSLARYLRVAGPPMLRVMLACALAALLFWTLTDELAWLRDAVATFTGGNMDAIREAFASWWAGDHQAVQIALLLLIILVVPKRDWRRLSWQSEPPLVREARRHCQRLQAEQTATTQASGALPLLQAAFNRSVAVKVLPWTMPELVGHLCRFLGEVTRTEHARGRRVLICIDEVDRIGSAEAATRFLSEIKAIFGSVNCYFLVAVADELGAAFSRRAITGRSHVDNAFDEVISLEPLSFESSKQLLQRRVPGFTDAFVRLVLALSGGLPRELIRVARRLVEINIEFEYELRLPQLADRLVREEIHEAVTGTRSQLAGTLISPEWGAVLDRLRLLDGNGEQEGGGGGRGQRGGGGCGGGGGEGP